MAGAIGALRVTLGADTAGFEQGMRRAATTAQRTGQDIERSYLRMSATGVRAFSSLKIGLAGLAGALAGNFLFQQARGALEWASGLGETAQQIGVTVQQLQIMRLAAQQNGASVEGMERAMSILNRTLGQARAGLPAAVQAFRSVGISQEQLQNLRSAGDAFPLVAEGISHFASEAEQAAAAQRLFGRGAAELLPLLAQGRAGWDAATQAAIRNGLVTEEQARTADEAADQLAALGTAIRVDLVNALGDALPGLVALGRTLGWVMGIVIRLVGWVFSLIGAIAQLFTRSALLDVVNIGAAGRPAGTVLGGIAAARAGGMGGIAGSAPGTARLSLGGGGGGRGRAAHDNSARNAHEFDTEERRLQLDILHAQMEQTQALDERNAIQGRIADLEDEQWRADLAYRVSQHEINAAQAEILTRKHDQLTLAEQINRVSDYNYRAAQEMNELAERQEGYAQDRVRNEADMAETMAERRRLELDLLRITMNNRRIALQQQIEQANAHGDPHAAALAQLELDNLGNVERQQRGQIMRNTRGPLETMLAGLPLTAAKMNEALENVAANGLTAITDGLVDAITGVESLGKAFKKVAASIIADLVRIAIQRAIIGPLVGALGGLLGGGGPSGAGFNFGNFLSKNLSFGGARAAGGPVLPGRTYLVGEKGPELLHMGGAGHVVANDNIGGGGDVHVHQTFKFEGVAVTQDEFMQGLMATKHATVAAIHQAQRRRG